MTPAFAFISAGRLFVRRDGAALREIESEFARETAVRREKSRQRHAWKGQGDDIQSALVWGKQAGVANDDVRPVEFRAATRGPEAGGITYSVQIGEVGGIFDGAADGTEHRLGHRAGWRVEEMERRAEDGALAYAQLGEGGTFHLALKRIDQNAGREITEGDSLDQSPSWVPGPRRKLVYQSAGVARNAQGFVVSVAPFAIQELDLETGEVVALLEDAAHDLLLPHKLADGSLLCLRRPYENPHRVGHWRAVRDFLLIPVHLFGALFGFLDVFSRRYSGKPLAKSGHTRAMQPDYKQMILWGRALEAEKQSRQINANEPRALAPDSWQLLQVAPSGEEQVLARGVLGYDVAGDGSVFYTDGKAIFRRGTDGKVETVLEHFPVEKIVALE